VTNNVQCYAGSTYPEKPRAFDWEGCHYVVEDILRRWREPQGFGFIVRCSQGSEVFSLFYRIEDDDWQIQTQGSIMIEEKPHQNKSLGE
jgi:hypothetical protein